MKMNKPNHILEWEKEQMTFAINYPEESKGLGDTIAKITKAIGIKPCGGCKKRQEWLNEKIPYNQDSVDSSNNSE